MSDLGVRLSALSTSTLSDALDRLGVEGQALGIHPLDRTFRVVGPAFTVRMLPRGLSGRSVGDYIDDVPAGHVVVIDNGGRLDATVWGDILTTIAARNGIGGTVIDGVCRDVDTSVEVSYPIFARSVTMRTGKDRVSAEEYEHPVQLAGVRVESSDWICGDGDGVVVIPRSVVVHVLEAAEAIGAAEAKIRDQLSAGSRLDEARCTVHYHELQTRQQL